MAEVLTVDEKQAIIGAHKRNIEMDKYNLELSLIEENSVTNPSEQIVSELQLKINQASAKLSALNAELESLTE